MRLSRHIATTLALVVLCGVFACSGDDPADPGQSNKWPAPSPLTIAKPLYPPGIEGFEDMPVPVDNPTTVQGVALGRRLFYDPILSGDSTQACASCHRFGMAFSEPQRFSVGIDSIAGSLNAPQLTNAGWLASSFWDGRAATLEDQALQPVVNPIEMHETWPNAEAKLQSHPDYPELFGRAFRTDVITKELVVKAIAQFERTFVSGNSKYDRFLRGEVALTAAESDGFKLFFEETGDCFHCHVDILGMDNSFHNIGLDSVFTTPESQGRGFRTGNPQDIGKFKTPTLRNVEVTAPYMHDGRFQTLEDVVNHYNSGGVGSDNVDALIRVGVGLGLTQQDQDALVAFLKTFTDPDFINNTDLAPPP